MKRLIITPEKMQALNKNGKASFRVHAPWNYPSNESVIVQTECNEQVLCKIVSSHSDTLSVETIK